MCRRLPEILFLFLLICGFVACGRLSRYAPWGDADGEAPAFVLDTARLRMAIDEALSAMGDGMYADAYARAYYNEEEGSPMLWFTEMGLDEQADTLLALIRSAGDIGLPPTAFRTDTLQALLDSVQRCAPADAQVSELLGRLEVMLTQSYLRYACGQRYGYVLPRRLFNHLLIDEPPVGETRQAVVYRQLYDQEADEVTDSFVHHALEQVRCQRLADFLQEVQPADTLYDRMLSDYRQAQGRGDTVRARLARINLERSRWRYPRPGAGRYVWVNLAGQELTAVDTERDTMFTMRVCCGNSKHKTPLLHSAIRWVELNPYWVIPQTIVRKEIVPYHVGDSAYFARNGYHAIEKETKEEVDPAGLSADQLRSARYTLRQEKGEGNSLGRIIFRFPNHFSVFLHDTNNHGAFQRQNRAISHGCVRVERPYDLALFMLERPTELFVDRIRMSIDMSPLSQAGLRYQEQNPEAEPMSGFSPSHPVPVWLDYWTLWPDPHGTLQAHADSYGYDRVIGEALDCIGIKPTSTVSVK